MYVMGIVIFLMLTGSLSSSLNSLSEYNIDNSFKEESYIVKGVNANYDERTSLVQGYEIVPLILNNEDENLIIKVHDRNFTSGIELNLSDLNFIYLDVEYNRSEYIENGNLTIQFDL